MKRKKIIKAVAGLLERPFIKMLFYVGGIVLVLAMSGALSENGNIINAFLAVIASQDTLSLFFAGLFSLSVIEVLRWFDDYMEESLKIEDNHHKIIAQYKTHKLGLPRYNHSFADKKGVFLVLKHLRKEVDLPQVPNENASKKARRTYEKNRRKIEKAVKARNSVKDVQSKDYIAQAKQIENYFKGELCLCSLNVFANVAADTAIRFNDRAEKHELPAFVITHADEILQAHKNSVKNNSNTVRLDDFTYDNHTLVLNTSRSTYYHMLITNRCMDYKFANGLSIREIYEYDDEICPLERSKLGNQIGINGLVVTSDNYVLIEKRGRKKITWKNKFAQSISLAMKLKDLNLDRKSVLDDDCDSAQTKIKGIIAKTLRENFGLTDEDYYPFYIKENFLGLARDLLEGGKPNLYFYVKTKYTAEELKRILEDNAKVVRADNAEGVKPRQVIATSKLESDYYLVPFEDIKISFDYRMSLDRKTALKVDRMVYPRCKKRVVLCNKVKSKISRIINPVLERECGEALLVTLAYMELRKQWVEDMQNKEKENVKTYEQ